MAGYTLSPLAAKDLEQIYEYTIETWGLEQFALYRARLNEAIETIAGNLEAVGSKSREDLFPGCRVFRAERHYLVYRNGVKGVEIARVLHERMDFERQVGDSSH